MGKVQEGVIADIYVVKYFATTGVFKTKAVIEKGKAYTSQGGVAKGLAEKYWAHTRDEAEQKLAELIGDAIYRAEQKRDELLGLKTEELMKEL